jgi:hypothetical protein
MPIYEALPWRSHVNARTILSPIFYLYFIPSLGMLPSCCDVLYAQFFLQPRPELTVNTVFHSCKNTANSAFRDKKGLHRSDQDILHLRNVIRLHGTVLIVTSLTRLRKLQSSLLRLLSKSWYNNMEYRFLRSMFTKSENKGENCK